MEEGAEVSASAPSRASGMGSWGSFKVPRRRRASGASETASSRRGDQLRTGRFSRAPQGTRLGFQFFRCALRHVPTATAGPRRGALVENRIASVAPMARIDHR